MIKFKVKVMLAMREMTQKELAERTGIRPPTVSAICTGSVKHLPVEALDKICDVLDCQPSDLMEYIKTENQGAAYFGKSFLLFAFWNLRWAHSLLSVIQISDYDFVVRQRLDKTKKRFKSFILQPFLSLLSVK